MRLIDADSIQYEPMLSAKGNGMYEDVMVAYKSQIDDLPTIEDRKTGKWIRGDAEKLTGSQRCSICHKACYKGKDYFNFCPNCGADMRGEGHE